MERCENCIITNKCDYGKERMIEFRKNMDTLFNQNKDQGFKVNVNCEHYEATNEIIGYGGVPNSCDKFLINHNACGNENRCDKKCVLNINYPTDKIRSDRGLPDKCNKYSIVKNTCTDKNGCTRNCPIINIMGNTIDE